MPRLIVMRMFAGAVALGLLTSCGGGGSGTAPRINDSAIVVTASPSPPAGLVTHPYSYGFTASGGSPPYTWQASGALPPGLELGSDGTVSGTPTQIGSFQFSVTATDSAQTPATGPPLATQIVINNPAALALNAMPAPPAGVDGTPYGPFSFSVTGGLLPLTWTATPSSLPPGLSLGSDGSLTGTPTGIQTFNFTVTVTDSSSPTPAKSSLPFSITITAPPAPAIDAAEPLTGTVGLMYTPFQFTVSGGLALLGWLETPLLTNGLSLSSDGIISGTPTVAGQFPITLTVTDALGQSASPVPVVVRVSLPHSGSFTVLSASMTAPRSGHTATLLTSGKVLIAGGANGAADASAELYDPATRAFTATGPMTEARIGHTATLLNDSARSVLMVGSADMSAERYNPATGTFTATGSMHHARTSPTATLLSSTGPNAGKVLIVGGNATSGDLVAELYDPGTGTFTDTGSTTILRSGHTATLLTAGPLADQVLIVGGSDSASAELYDPATGMFTKTGDMTVTRSGHTATALGTQDGAQDGDVLIVGTDGSADLYDPSKGAFARIGSLLPPMQSRTAHTANLLETVPCWQPAAMTSRVVVDFSAPSLGPRPHCSRPRVMASRRPGVSARGGIRTRRPCSRTGRYSSSAAQSITDVSTAPSSSRRPSCSNDSDPEWRT